MKLLREETLMRRGDVSLVLRTYRKPTGGEVKQCYLIQDGEELAVTVEGGKRRVEAIGQETFWDFLKRESDAS